MTDSCRQDCSFIKGHTKLRTHGRMDGRTHGDFLFVQVGLDVKIGYVYVWYDHSIYEGNTTARLYEMDTLHFLPSTCVVYVK